MTNDEAFAVAQLATEAVDEIVIFHVDKRSRHGLSDFYVICPRVNITITTSSHYHGSYYVESRWDQSSHHASAEDAIETAAALAINRYVEARLNNR